ncbi:MAG: right-handed parallel beta-helix repeat-containing protein, partial [Planctomycetes bacterium]|nr:right-handed parallel beta-helix repeat-containing protein [Planctomycetota bacterium]
VIEDGDGTLVGGVERGGGILITGGASPTIRNCYVADNSDGGIAIIGAGSSPVIEDCSIYVNSGGGIVVGGAGSSPLIDNCMIYENISVGIDAIDGSSPTIRSSTVHSHTGSGMQISGGADVTIEGTAGDRTLFYGNEAGGAGGGAIHVLGATSSVAASNCDFGTVALGGNTGGVLGGGAVLLDGGAGTFVNCGFTGNAGGFCGGAIHALGTALTLTDCEFTDNAADVLGGAVVIAHDFDLSGQVSNVTDCTFVENETVRGAALYVEGTTTPVAVAPILNLFRCVFSGNESLAPATPPSSGGAILCGTGEGTINLTNCTLDGNNAEVGDAISVGEPVPSNLTSDFDVVINNSIIWDSSLSIEYEPLAVGQGAGTIFTSYSDVEDFDAGVPVVVAGTGNINEDPLFADAAAGDFSLTSDCLTSEFSPCIDAGDPASPADEDGSVADMGVVPTLVFLFKRGDSNGDGTFNALLDALFLLQYGFAGGPEPPCFDAADANDTGVYDALLDPLRILNYQFAGAPVPPAPGPETCGSDPTCDALSCDSPGCDPVP